MGIATNANSLNGVYYAGIDAEGYGYEQSSGNKYRGGSGAAYGASYTDGDVIRCEVDFGAGTIRYYKNNVSQGIAFSGIVAGTYFPCIGIPNNGGQWTADFSNW